MCHVAREAGYRLPPALTEAQLMLPRPRSVTAGAFLVRASQGELLLKHLVVRCSYGRMDLPEEQRVTGACATAVNMTGTVVPSPSTTLGRSATQ